MPAKSPRDAVAAFRQNAAALTACVTDRPVFATGFRPSPRTHHVSFVPVDEAAPLRLGQTARAFALEVRTDYQIDLLDDDQYAVRIIGYAYQINERMGRELLALHWHPFGLSWVRFPHLHLSSRIPRFDLDAGVSVALAGMHIPTGFVTFADVIRLLIVEFGVKPRRADWESILRQQAE